MRDAGTPSEHLASAANYVSIFWALHSHTRSQHFQSKGAACVSIRSSGMQLSVHQEGSPLSPEEILLMEISGSVSHCAPRASGKITMAHICGLDLLLVGAHAEAEDMPCWIR